MSKKKRTKDTAPLIILDSTSAEAVYEAIDNDHGEYFGSLSLYEAENLLESFGVPRLITIKDQPEKFYTLPQQKNQAECTVSQSEPSEEGAHE